LPRAAIDAAAAAKRGMQNCARQTTPLGVRAHRCGTHPLLESLERVVEAGEVDFVQLLNQFVGG